MRKLFALTLACLSMFAFSANARNAKGEYINYIEPRVSLGVYMPGTLKAGPLSIDAFSPGLDYSAGIGMNIALTNFLFVEPAVQYYCSNYSMNKDFLKLGNVTIDGTGLWDDFDLTASEHGIRIPVMLGLNLFREGGIGLNVFTGPSFDFRMYGVEKVSGKINGKKISNSETMSDDEFNQTTTFWSIGAGVNIDKLSLRLETNLGLNNRLNTNSDNASMHSSRISLSLGYQF